MKSFVQEYGLIVIIIIGVSFFFHIWSDAFFGSEGVYFVYNTWRPDIATVTTNGSIVNSIVDSRNNVPYFDISDSKSFIIESDTYTKSQFLSGVTAKFANGSTLSGITVIVYKYTPLMADENLGVNGHVMMTSEYVNRYGYDELVKLSETGKYTEVFATDKYGSYIYDNDGKKVVSEQPIYRISYGKVLGDNEYIDTSDVSEKYKVVYRVQSGVFKAEYEAFFVKKSDSVGTSGGLSGYTKVDFDYEIDDDPVRIDDSEAGNALSLSEEVDSASEQQEESDVEVIEGVSITDVESSSESIVLENQ